MLTVMIDLKKIKSKKFIQFPNIHHEDYALWLKLFNNKTIKECYTLKKVLACYNINNKSVSANKFYSAIWTFKCYRFSGMNPIISIYRCIYCTIKNLFLYIKNFF